MEHDLSTTERESFLTGARRRSLRFNPRDEGLKESVCETLEEFLNRGWEIFQCSPLFGFEGTELQLKKYSLILRHHCASMDVDEDVAYMVTFKYLDNVGVDEKDGIIKVEVQYQKEGNEKNTQLYLGYFMSWGARRSYTEFVFLPLLLCKSKTTMAKAHIHEVFRKLFDSTIEPYILGELQLIWLNSLFLSVSKEAEDERQNIVQLTLRPPWTTEIKSELFISLTDLKKIWTRISSQETDTIYVQETRQLYEGVLKSISKEVLIKLSGFRIYEIKYPDVTVRWSGKFSCTNVETLNELLSFLYNEKPCVDFLTGSEWEDIVEAENP